MQYAEIPKDVLDAWLCNKRPLIGDEDRWNRTYPIKCLTFTFIGQVTWSESYVQYIFSLCAVKGRLGEWRSQEAVVTVEDFEHICRTLTFKLGIFAVEGLYPDPTAGTDQIGEVYIHGEVTQLNPRSRNQ